MATFDHFVLRVSDFDVAAPYYRALFDYSGFTEVPDPQDARCVGFQSATGLTLWIEEQKDLVVGKSLGWLDHFALHCSTTDQVDSAHAFCLNQGWEVITKPKSYPAYGNFYGFSFRGPDGIKLEFVTR